MFAHLGANAPVAAEPSPRSPGCCSRRSSRAGPLATATRSLLRSLLCRLLLLLLLAPAELPQRRRRRRPAGPMRAPPQPLVVQVLLSLLILGSGPCTTGLELNDTSSGRGELLSGDHSADGLAVTSRTELSSGTEVSSVSEVPAAGDLSSGAEEDYPEEYDGEPHVSGYIVDGAVRVEQVIKPKKNKAESEKTSDKPKKKKKGGKNGKDRKNKKKKNPCEAEYKTFCIHGECKYIEHLKTVTCRCQHDYFGERCGEKSMKTQSIVDSDLSKIAVAAIVAFVSAVSFTAVAVIITVQLRKRYIREYAGEAEERKKLRQENGNAHAIA